MNLIINARDAMPDGGTIAISAENRSAGAAADGDLKPGDYVVITVADSGCGIAPDLLEQVMEPFFTTKEVGKGTGLGLSMAYGFARQSGGAFRLESEFGAGTRASIWLPRGYGNTLSPGDSTSRSEVRQVPPLRILLVDDHDGVRETTAAMLADLGHEVVAAADGSEVAALLASKAHCWELMITDYAMPHLSGAEIIRQARERCSGLPAIIITGYADERSIARRPSDVAVLRKPFSPDQLRDAIASAVLGSARQPELKPEPMPAAQ